MPCTMVKGVVLLFTGNNAMNKRLCRVSKSPARIIKIPASRLKGSFIVCFSSSLFHATFVDLSWDTFVGSVELRTWYKVGVNGLGLPFGELEYRREMERDGEVKREEKGRKYLQGCWRPGERPTFTSWLSLKCYAVSWCWWWGCKDGYGVILADNLKLRHEMT